MRKEEITKLKTQIAKINQENLPKGKTPLYLAIFDARAKFKGIFSANQNDKPIINISDNVELNRQWKNKGAFFQFDIKNYGGIGLIVKVFYNSKRKCYIYQERTVNIALQKISKINYMFLNRSSVSILEKCYPFNFYGYRKRIDLKNTFEEDKYNLLRYCWFNPYNLQTGENTKIQMNKLFKDKKIVFLNKENDYVIPKEDFGKVILVFNKQFSNVTNKFIHDYCKKLFSKITDKQIGKVLEQQDYCFFNTRYGKKKVVKVTPKLDYHFVAKSLFDNDLLELLIATILKNFKNYNLSSNGKKIPVKIKTICMIFKKEDDKYIFKNAVKGHYNAPIKMFLKSDNPSRALFFNWYQTKDCVSAPLSGINLNSNDFSFIDGSYLLFFYHINDLTNRKIDFLIKNTKKLVKENNYKLLPTKKESD